MNECKKMIAVVLFVTLALMGFKSTEIQGNLIGKQIAIFYPADFDAKANLPSFAFEKEPVSTGEIPSRRKMVPSF